MSDLPAFILTKLTSAECDIVFVWKDKALASALEAVCAMPFHERTDSNIRAALAKVSRTRKVKP